MCVQTDAVETKDETMQAVSFMVDNKTQTKETRQKEEQELIEQQKLEIDELKKKAAKKSSGQDVLQFKNKNLRDEIDMLEAQITRMTQKALISDGIAQEAGLAMNKAKSLNYENKVMRAMRKWLLPRLSAKIDELA